MTTIDINAAEKAILHVLPSAKALENNSINTKGIFLVFANLVTENDFLGDVAYAFKLYVAISSKTGNQKLAYAPLSQCLSQLITHWQTHQWVKIGRIKPNASKGLIIYEVQLTYTPYAEEI